MASRLDFLVFYRGNMVNGFDYVYTKRYEGHAFWQARPKDMTQSDVLDDEYDFYNPHFNAQGEPFNWRYHETWVDMTNVWDHFSQEATNYLNSWMSEYPGPTFDDPSRNDEWGVRFRVPGQPEQIIWGINAFPANLDAFSDFIYRFGTTQP